jgi:hypothetical protein
MVLGHKTQTEFKQPASHPQLDVPLVDVRSPIRPDIGADQKQFRRATADMPRRPGEASARRSTTNYIIVRGFICGTAGPNGMATTRSRQPRLRSLRPDGKSLAGPFIDACVT